MKTPQRRLQNVCDSVRSDGGSKHPAKEFETLAVILMREIPEKRFVKTLCERNLHIWKTMLDHLKAVYERITIANMEWVGA